MVMNTIGIADLKARLSEHLRSVRAGQVLTILDRRTPVARIVPLQDQESDLVVHSSEAPLQDLPLPPPMETGVDVVDELLEERADRL